jgi:hypothetical protein
MAALALEGQHALSPSLAGELVGFPVCFNRALGGYAEGGASLSRKPPLLRALMCLNSHTPNESAAICRVSDRRATALRSNLGTFSYCDI